MTVTMLFRYIESPIGQLLLAGDERGLKYIGFPQGKGKLSPQETWQLDAECFADAEMQLCEYFEGKRKRFDLKLAPTGTPFQLSVLQALQTIPAGETRSYLEIARQIGRRDKSSGRGERAQSPADSHPMPPCYRFRRQPDRIWRRIEIQAFPAATGRCKTEADNQRDLF
jgi:methylated-DNA-[protein]-cysteine S-methyltransferase